MRWMWTVPLALATLAGCLGGDDEVPDDEVVVLPEDWYRSVMPHAGSDEGHDHGDPLQHQNLSTPNFRVLGWDPLVTEYHGTTSGAYYCGEVSELDGRTIAAYHSFSTDVALVLVDVTDPRDPQLVGELILPLTHVYDVALADDGTFAVLATSPLDMGPDDLAGLVPALAGPTTYPVRPVFRDACGNTYEGPLDNVPYASGIVLVDLSDLAAPAIADYEPQPALGAHSVSETVIDNVTYVAASTTNLVHQVSYFTFWNVEALPVVGLQFVPYGSFTAQYPGQPGAPTGFPLVNGHVDATLQRHPGTGQLLAYLANWDGGMMIVELVAPGVVLPVSEWTGIGQIHETLPMPELWGDRHITIIGQEAARAVPGGSGYVALIDTTDPADPHAVAWWSLPLDDVQYGGLTFSTHYVEVVDRTLLVSMYHGGVWAADAAEENWPALPTVGVLVPAYEPPQPPFAGGPAPEVLDVNALSDGRLIVFDGYSGAYSIAFEPGDPRVPVAPPLPLEPDWIRT